MPAKVQEVEVYEEFYEEEKLTPKEMLTELGIYVLAFMSGLPIYLVLKAIFFFVIGLF